MNDSANEGMPRGRFFPLFRMTAGSVPFLAAFLALCLAAFAQELPNLAAPGHPGWKEKVFAGHTVYTPFPKQNLLMAESNGTASGLYAEQTVDLRRTPWLTWTWKVENVLSGVNERTKSGDDYPARVYVVAKGGLAFWKTKALSYVWASSEPEGALWANAFTSNAAMIALRSGNDRVGELVTEKRNIREDWQHAFGEDITELHAVAIMTDTDNSNQFARAWYGPPRFSAE